MVCCGFTILRVFCGIRTHSGWHGVRCRMRLHASGVGKCANIKFVMVLSCVSRARESKQNSPALAAFCLRGLS